MRSLLTNGRKIEAMLTFQQNPDTTGAVALLCDVFHNRKPIESALSIYKHYDSQVAVPDILVFDAFLTVCSKSNDYSHVPALFDDIINKRIRLNKTSFGKLTKMCADTRNTIIASTLFEMMKNYQLKFFVNILDCTQLISAFVRSGKPQEALNVLEWMVQNGITPDDTTNTILATQVQHLINTPLPAGVAVEVWNNSIALKVRNRNIQEAIDMFYQMQKQIMQPTAATYRSSTQHNGRRKSLNAVQ